MDMYCKNCGSQMAPGYNYCVHCGVPSNMGDAYCDNCGKPFNGQRGINCLSCGSPTGLPAPAQPAPKSRLVAGILGVMLGIFGVHNFYLGNTGKAVAQLLITVLSCFLLSPVSAVWGCVEGIFILIGRINSDGKGVPLQD